MEAAMLLNASKLPFGVSIQPIRSMTRCWQRRILGMMRIQLQQYVGRFLATFKEFPPRQKPASFSIDQVMEKMKTATVSK